VTALPQGDEPAGAALARLYDLDLQDDPGDLPLYEALARRTGGPILELGVGTGRLAIPLVSAGHDVTGVDLDPWMLRRASDASPDAGRALELIEADMRSVRLDRRFGLVILALNTLLQLGSRDAQQDALRTVAAHLAPEGLAVVDVWIPAASDLALYDGRLLVEWERHDPERDERVAKIASATHDAATATVELRTWFDRWPADGGPVRRVERDDRMRLIGAEELVAMASDAGIEPDSLGGDHQMAPWGAGSERLVLVGRLV
jgi:SAM-dependent methyltransferase